MTRFLSFATAFIAIAVSAPTVTADSPLNPASEEQGWAEFRLSDQPSSSLSSESPSAKATFARLWQQRAAYQQSQRLARIEANAWLGHAPLRPSWSSVPMMSSRYSGRQVIVIPVYVP